MPRHEQRDDAEVTPQGAKRSEAARLGALDDASALLGWKGRGEKR
jgi:hypothetical protein